MELKEKLDLIYENQQKVFDAGYNKGISSDGGSEFDLGRLCREIRFNPNIFDKSEVVLNLDNATSIREIFYASTRDLINTTVEHITINCKQQVADMYRMFNGSNAWSDTTLKRITINIDTSKNGNINNFAQNCRALEIIDGSPFDFSNCNQFNSTFAYCIELKELRVVENTIHANITFKDSTKLSKTTIESVINGLSNETNELTLTLSLQAVNKAFETSEGANDGSTSAEWTTLVNTKQNWTINLE